MNQPINAVLIGAGQRGTEAYGPYALQHPEQLRFIAVAEPDLDRRERFARQHNIYPDNQFQTWEPLLAGPRLGQAALVCTQDQQHTAPAVAALRRGYDVLLEKPMATTPSECRHLVEVAGETGQQLHICHVLRYTTHFQQMREIIQSGVLGQIVNVSHRENVSWWHMSHSFVRGNWRKTAESAPMILAKCCHDFDILTWMLDRNCECLSSVGGLLHYRPENAPGGAPERCLDGCPYYAPFIYIDMLPLLRGAAKTPQRIPRQMVKLQQRAPGLVKALSLAVPSLRELSDYRGWPLSVVAQDPTPENLLGALKEGPYGRCVYHCDNDVVDHQVVAMEFQGGLSVSLTMHGHSHLEGRTTRIQGSRGELQANFGFAGSWIEVNEHASGHSRRYDTSGELTAGHGGGDHRLVAAFVEAVQANDEALALTTARQSLESHLMAFAAEDARIEGRVIRRIEFRG
jgi:predicted dehydrogenase